MILVTDALCGSANHGEASLHASVDLFDLRFNRREALLHLSGESVDCEFFGHEEIVRAD